VDFDWLILADSGKGVVLVENQWVPFQMAFGVAL